MHVFFFCPLFKITLSKNVNMHKNKKYTINDQLNESFLDPISNPYIATLKSICQYYVHRDIIARIHIVLTNYRYLLYVTCKNVHQLGQWSLRSTPRLPIVCQSVNTSCRIKRFNALHTRSWSRWSSKQTVPSRFLCLYTAALIAFKRYLHLVDSREKFIDTANKWIGGKFVETRWYSPLKLTIDALKINAVLTSALSFYKKE